MELPSQRHLATVTALQTVTDAEGHRFTIRRLTALDKLRLFKAAGPALSQNHLWLGMATLACSVSSIDDVPIPAPTTEAQVESLVSRLGDSGIAAIASALAPESPPVELAAHAGN
jgi:hypothetical protein